MNHLAITAVCLLAVGILVVFAFCMWRMTTVLKDTFDSNARSHERVADQRDRFVMQWIEKMQTSDDVRASLTVSGQHANESIRKKQLELQAESTRQERIVERDNRRLLKDRELVIAADGGGSGQDAME